MRISDWSSDVCSSDLYAPLGGRAGYPSLYWSALKDDMRVRNFLLHKAPAAPDIDLDASSYDGLLPAKPSTEASARFLADLMRRGGRVMIGSHGDYDGIGMHWEMWVRSEEHTSELSH